MPAAPKDAKPMSVALDLLAFCRGLGIDLAAGPGDILIWEADADPTVDLLVALRQHKAELLALLRLDVAAWEKLAAERDAIRCADPLASMEAANLLGAWDVKEPVGCCRRRTTIR
jgi:hypothetical protein